MEKAKRVNYITMNKFIAITWILFIASCATEKIVDKIDDMNRVDVAVSQPVESHNITLECDTTCRQSERDAIPEIEKEVNRVIRTQCFEDFFNSQKNITSSDGLTGLQIVNKIRTTKVKTTMSYYYKRFTRTVGYEKGDGKIYANRKYWDFFKLVDKVSNVAHEATHLMGFHHNGNNPKGNELSVPYLTNQAVEKCL